MGEFLNKNIVYRERIKNFYDSDFGRELSDGLTYFEKRNLYQKLLDIDFYDMERKEQFYETLSHNEKEIYRKMLYANIDYEIIEFLLCGHKKRNLKFLVRRFYDMEKNKCVVV